ncbi:MAG TPA: PilZ domain-containing protein [Rhizomicrobium sp.]|nr:PilZ domain-containing protein [Rhizomicrobium sp.]
MRRRVLLSGVIYVPKSHSTFDCSIRDLSDSGARIDVRAGALIPTRFQLINVKDQIGYEVQCVRRNGREMALKTLRLIPLADASSFEARQLRRLLVERLQR